MRVSVIIPTWQRHDLLLQRCIPSVLAQTFEDYEIIVCSDGPDRTLRSLVSSLPVTYTEVAHHDEHRSNFGSRARNQALRTATGEIIAYLDDDNAWRPDHLALTLKALDDNPAAGFAYTRLVTQPQGTVIGTDPPVYGGIDTSVIVHRRGLLNLAIWPKPNRIRGDAHAPDWAIVEAWLAKGAAWVHVPTVTVDYHFAGS